MAKELPSEVSDMMMISKSLITVSGRVRDQIPCGRRKFLFGPSIKGARISRPDTKAYGRI